MSTNKTENLSLHSWDQDDPVLRSEFNENFEAIDSAFGTTWADVMAGPKVVVGSYVGTGTCGASNRTSLTFDFVPKIVMVWGTVSSESGVALYGEKMASRLSSSTACTTTWNGSTVTWYAENATMQLNNAITYYYLAIG